MHYRKYKTTIQDCLAILDTLTDRALTVSDRLWIKGILGDIAQFYSGDTPPASLVRMIDQIHTIEATNFVENLSQFLSSFKSDTHVKIRIDLFLARPVSVTYLLPVYYQLCQYDFFDVRLIAMEFYPQNMYHSNSQYTQLIEYLESKNVSFTPYNQYDLHDELPDIAFYSFHNHIFMKPLRLQHSSVTPIVKRTMFLEYTLFPNDFLFYNSSYTINPYTWLQFRSSHFSKNAIAWGEQDVVTGHPLLDLSYDIYSGRTEVLMPDGWKPQLEGKRVVLWNLTPQLNADATTNIVHTRQKINDTLDLIKVLSQKFDGALAFILRPHPLCYLPELHESFSQLSKHVILDRNPDSFPALYYADAFVGDSGSLYAQFLPSGRPALILNVSFREPSFVFWTQTNTASSLNDVAPFVERILNNYDSMQRPVTGIDQYCLGKMDGQNSRRIAESIISKFITEECSFIARYCPSLVNDALIKEYMQ